MNPDLLNSKALPQQSPLTFACAPESLQLSLKSRFLYVENKLVDDDAIGPHFE